jgi:uncharacterized cupredoxin-like copper-binding protein
MNWGRPFFSRARGALSALGVTALLAACTLALGVGSVGAVDTTATSAPTTSSAPAAGPSKIPVSARNFRFAPSKLTIASGQRVTIALKSLDGPHDFVVNGSGLTNKKIVTVQAGKAATGKLVLPKAGTYQFYCSLPGHRAAGMRGTITAT